ncbi:MAG TPA: DUF1015 family protein [Pyrinomonadaceae bacterium]|nr:DUF1015 family protein [Pyrinomonadaceae bacterium]
MTRVTTTKGFTGHDKIFPLAKTARERIVLAASLLQLTFVEFCARILPEAPGKGCALGRKVVADIRPFKALRPLANRAAEVASVPYDVVNTEEARALAAGKPLSFLHVSRPEIDLPADTDIHSDEVYRKASENLQKLVRDAPLEVEEAPSIYLYRLIMGEHEQVGIVAACSVDEYDQDLIRKHERTRRDKEDDRTRHMMALKAQTGPVFLTYRCSRDIDTMVMETMMANAVFDFTAEDGIQHTVWRVPDPVRFVHAFREVPVLYIADGHHRAASASRARAEMKQGNSEHTGDEDYNFFLAVMFPDEQLRILPYNRTVKDLNGLSNDSFLDALRKQFVVTENGNPEPATRAQWSMYLDGRWYTLQLPADVPAPQGIVDSLDVSILQDRLLDPILGIKDVRTDKRIDFIGGMRGTKELERLVDGGKAAVAFSLFPTTLADLLRVSDEGQIMPPKSTWFEPKLRDGLLIHTIQAQS